MQQENLAKKIYSLVLEKFKDLNSTETKHVKMDSKLSDKMSSFVLSDYLLTMRFQKAFALIELCMKYHLIVDKNAFDQTVNSQSLRTEEDFINLQLHVPRDAQTLEAVKIAFPALSGIISDLKSVLSMPGFKVVCFICDIPISFYHTLIDVQTADLILKLSDEYEHLHEIVHKVVKDIMHIHLKVARKDVEVTSS